MDAEQAAPILGRDMAATPLDSDDGRSRESNHGGLLLFNPRKWNKVVMKLKGTPASSQRGSFRSSLVDKSCIVEGDMSGREVGKALAETQTLKQHGDRLK